jgi:hypothetical protein
MNTLVCMNAVIVMANALAAGIAILDMRTRQFL